MRQWQAGADSVLLSTASTTTLQHAYCSGRRPPQHEDLYFILQLPLLREVKLDSPSISSSTVAVSPRDDHIASPINTKGIISTPSAGISLKHIYIPPMKKQNLLSKAPVRMKLHSILLKVTIQEITSYLRYLQWVHC